MKILVCIKQVPAGSVPLDGSNGTLDRKQTGGRINPWDLYALNAGIKIKKQTGGTVTALTMGPERAREVLETALATGADEGILLSDRAFAGADVYATAYTIAQGIKAAGDFDLVICGQQTTDGDTAQLPFYLAVRLGVPGIGWVKEIVDADTEKITLLQELGMGTQKAEVPYPCLIAAGEGVGKPGLPTLMDQLKAKKKEIKVLTIDSLDEKDPGKYGLKASPTRVFKISEVSSKRKTEPLIPEGNLLEIIKKETENKGSEREGKTGKRLLKGVPETGNGTLSVWIQLTENGIHPISEKVIETALSLGRERKLKVRGIAFSEKYNEQLLKELEETGLDEIYVAEGKNYGVFIPETMVPVISEITEKSEIFLVPATPEGRTVSSMVAAKLGTGVTADCTELSFNEEGLLVQTRPAFSGNVMASILTRDKRPEMASLRFGQEKPQIGGAGRIIKTEKETTDISSPYRAEIMERAETGGETGNIILAVGGGVKKEEDLIYFRKISDLLGAEFCSSRALVDRGWMPKKTQIGLSGRSVSPDILITLGVSGSLQFMAGLENPGRIIAVNEDPDAPIMKNADRAFLCDIYKLALEVKNGNL